MKRIQLFEFEDQKWFPDFMRASMTRLIVLLHKVLGLGDVLARLIQEALEKSGQKQVVDLGSGAGGAMPHVMDLLAKSERHNDTRMLLTDLYPNAKTVDSITRIQNPQLSYHPTSVNATDLQHAPKGLKTMVNSFHHMPPQQARQILESAYTSKEPLLIYEMAENKMPLLLWWLLLPISLCILIVMTFVMTPFVRPLTFGQLVFTYLIPIIPIAYAWDGQASYPRMYAYKDFDTLLDGLKDDSYSWTVAPAKNAKGKTQGYYLMGIPTTV